MAKQKNSRNLLLSSTNDDKESRKRVMSRIFGREKEVLKKFEHNRRNTKRK
jgi:hypothetical protein